MSRVVRFEKTGSPDVLQIVDVGVAAPKAGEVRIRVKAMGLNRAEALFRAGQYMDQPKLPAGLRHLGTRQALDAAGSLLSLQR